MSPEDAVELRHTMRDAAVTASRILEDAYLDIRATLGKATPTPNVPEAVWAEYDLLQRIERAAWDAYNQADQLYSDATAGTL